MTKAISVTVFSRKLKNQGYGRVAQLYAGVRIKYRHRAADIVSQS